ncbi:hypothetical protein BOX15_Mlig026915g2 [Macrostomum lignano]|uniref:LITAF domain-containing protein n=1 Tax=Macrostomum lignano TaxID=282301 RepID=A0A267FZT5_9PLAT|nr:hypothetical protein BOX15_Mlig026915g2 [Macrostomum lignano]
MLRSERLRSPPISSGRIRDRGGVDDWPPGHEGRQHRHQSQHQPDIVITQIGPDPLPMTCPYCYKDIVTLVKKYNGLMPWLLCPLFCCFPFCCDRAKDAVHTCPGCGQIVGRYMHC